MLGHALLLFPMDEVYVSNIILMVIGPLSTCWLNRLGHVGMCYGAEVTSHSAVDEVVTRHHRFLAMSKLAMTAVAGWGRFWISLVI